MSAQWHVLSVKPHKESAVKNYLNNEEITCYCPTIKVKPVNPRSRHERPFFPGYLFVYINLEEEGDNRLRWIPGARGLVRFGDQPAIVPETLIAELHKKIKAYQQQKETGNLLQKGDPVRIMEGPFAGYEAIFDAHLSGKDRVQVLLAFLNHQNHRLRLNKRDIKKL